MKKFAVLFSLFLFSHSGFSKDPDSKIFLVLFKSFELKNYKINLKSIEEQFSPFFSTKSYDGNSELALIIEIPSCDFDACFLGEFLVKLENGQNVQLQNLSFRLFDLTENRSLHQSYIAKYEESLMQKKKSSKASKFTTLP
jgi:hypothetical protein